MRLYLIHLALSHPQTWHQVCWGVALECSVVFIVESGVIAESQADYSSILKSLMILLEMEEISYQNFNAITKVITETRRLINQFHLFKRCDTLPLFDNRVTRPSAMTPVCEVRGDLVG